MAQRLWDKLKKGRPLPLLGSFGLGCALSAGQWGGVYAPWCISYVASRGASPRGFTALLGALLGSYLFFPFQEALRHGATVLLIYAAALSFSGSRWERRSFLAPLYACAALLAVHSVYLVGREFYCAALWLFSGITVYLLTRRMQGISLREQTELIGLGLCLSLSPVTVDGFSVGLLGGVWLSLWLSSTRPPAESAALGACIGLAFDLTLQQPSGTLAALLAASCCGAAYCRSRHGKAVVFCALSFSLSVLLRYEQAAALCFTCCTASASFLLTPHALQPERPASLLTETCTPQAGAFRALYDALFGQEEEEKTENPAVIFDRAAEKICRTCPQAARCYHREYQSTHDAFACAAGKALHRGQAAKGDFPDWFSENCARFTPFLSAVNDELYAYLLRSRYHHRLHELRRLAALPYAQMGSAMEDSVSAVKEDAHAALDFFCATRPKGGQTLCGDEVAAFTVGAVSYLLLSDGMGSGKEAHAEASMTVRLLRQFLEAGITPESSLQTLNTALRLREGDGFTTIDLMSFRCADGSAAFHKYGACQSYLRRSDGRVETVSAVTLPAGLETRCPPPSAHMLLHHGDIVVLLSDGVVGQGDGELRRLLRSWTGPMDALAGAVLALCPDGDDCAVITARCRRRSLTRV